MSVRWDVLTEAQTDGRACMYCGGEAADPMVPLCHHPDTGTQLFAHEDCSEAVEDDRITRYDRPQPMQEVVDVGGIHRFRENALVRYLLDAGGLSLNQLALLPNIDGADWEQLAQLIGYSVSGFGDLSYASEGTVARADAASEKLAGSAPLAGRRES